MEKMPWTNLKVSNVHFPPWPVARPVKSCWKFKIKRQCHVHKTYIYAHMCKCTCIVVCVSRESVANLNLFLINCILFCFPLSPTFLFMVKWFLITTVISNLVTIVLSPAILLWYEWLSPTFIYWKCNATVHVLVVLARKFFKWWWSHACPSLMNRWRGLSEEWVCYGGNGCAIKVNSLCRLCPARVFLFFHVLFQWWCPLMTHGTLIKHFPTSRIVRNKCLFLYQFHSL